MKTCPAPCKYKDIEDEYSTNVSNFKNFLKGHSDKVLEMLENRMKQFSDEMEFERAINEREKLAVLKRMLETQIIEYSKEIDEDVFVFEEKGKMCSYVC